MKFARCLLLLPLILCFSSCGLLTLELSQDIDEVTVKGFDITNPKFDSDSIFPPVAINIDLDAQIAAQETGPASAAYLKNFKLYITNTAKSGPTDEDYFNDFLSAINIYLEGYDKSALPRKKIAWVTSMSPKSSALEFTVDSNVDILPYIQKGARVVSDVGGLKLPADDVSYAGSFTVTIKI